MMHSSFLAAASVVSLLGILQVPMLANALTGSPWSMTNVPSSGLKDITFPITILEADHVAGYYFSQDFNFVGQSDIGYTGIQPRPDSTTGKPILHGTFSSFINGTTMTDANCTPGADNGPGVSCSVEWNGVYGRKYNFEVKTTGNSRLWVGTVIDSVTGKHMHIGSYTLPPGTQGIQGSQIGFVEWYPWNNGEPEDHCAKLPYQRTMFWDPTTTRKGSVGTVGPAYEYGDCIGEVAFGTKKVWGGFENNCGFRGQTGY